VVFAKSIGSLVTDATRSLISHVARSVTFAIDALIFVGVQLCKFVLIAPKKGGRWAMSIFPIKNALDCRILHIKSQKFSGVSRGLMSHSTLYTCTPYITVNLSVPWRLSINVLLNCNATAQFNVVVETNTNRLIEATRNKTPK